MDTYTVIYFNDILYNRSSGANCLLQEHHVGNIYRCIFYCYWCYRIQNEAEH